MKTLALSSAVVLMSVLPLAAQDADEVDPFGESLDAHLEFIRNLRQRGHADLAREYVDLLLLRLDGDDARFLSLTKQRSAVDLARSKTKVPTPWTLAELAAHEYRKFLNDVEADPRPVPPLIRVDLAELLAMCAPGRFKSGWTPDDQIGVAAGSAASRNLHELANEQFILAIKGLREARRDDLADAVHFEQAKNLIESCGRYQNPKVVLEPARKILMALAEIEPYRLLAHAYLARCYYELENNGKRAEHMNVVEKATGPGAAAAQRLVRYVRVLSLLNRSDPTPEGAKRAVEAAEEWLKAYPAPRRSPENEHLRFDFAVFYLQRASDMSDELDSAAVAKIGRNPAKAAIFRGYVESSYRIASELSAEPGVFSRRAGELVTEIERAKAHLRMGSD